MYFKLDILYMYFKLHILYIYLSYVIIFIVPDKVSGVDLVCYPVNLIVECSAEWEVLYVRMYVYNFIILYTGTC